MKKIWAFVEGDSENHFITNIIRNKFSESISTENDLIEFIEVDLSNCFHNILYCENCNSVNKIPHRINELYYLIERSESNDILIICDVEKLQCHINRKKEIEERLDNSVNKNKIKFVFFNPNIESFYWDCPQLIKSIIKKQYRIKFKESRVPGIPLPNSISNPIYDIKKCIKNMNIKYRESLFA